LKRHIIYLAQAVYYFITGLWPVVDIISFMRVTGPKTDIWLVKMVGLLTIAISITLLMGNKQGITIKVLALSAALSYLAIDLYYYFNGTLRVVYLGDAVLESIIILLVLIARK
jgi:hypothetical protein